MSNTNNSASIAIRFGLLTGVIKIILDTLTYQFFLDSWLLMTSMTVVSFAAGITLMIIAGKQQRSEMGGYMDIKEAFRVVFITALIAVVINYAYGYIYMHFIDTTMMDKIKEASISSAEKWGAPQETLDRMADEFDKQNLEKNNISKQMLGLAGSIVLYGILSFICAAIIKKNKPKDLA